MMKNAMLAGLMAVAAMGAGCGDVLDDILPSKGSCTTPSPRSCTDYTGDAWSTPSSGSRACTAVGNGATYSSSACATSGRVGSCVVNSGMSSEAVLRFYPPSTTATAQAACGAQAGSRFVAN
ncbi:MAG: hypothetical protein JWM10_91 [Myxococcaceae bacterium]|nr:hypothetical protein [Myxococcaceae bacterium]